MVKLDFTKHNRAQDMIRLIEDEKNLSAAEVIEYAVNFDNFKRIIKTGWASIALDLWGHGDPDREWEVMDNPCIEVNLDENKTFLLDKIQEADKIDIETAVSYFLIFTMSEMGYHI